VSPYTALLESLHSALVDELTERHPEPKPELGMPTRSATFSLPDPSARKLLACQIGFEREKALAVASAAETLGGPRGIALLATSAEFDKALGTTAPKLWAAVLARAGSEFARRGIRPVFSAPDLLDAPTALPAGYPVPGRFIWIPFRLPKGPGYLGVGA
jgi:hypothetical protein